MSPAINDPAVGFSPVYSQSCATGAGMKALVLLVGASSAYASGIPALSETGELVSPGLLGAARGDRGRLAIQTHSGRIEFDPCLVRLYPTARAYLHLRYLHLKSVSENVKKTERTDALEAYVDALVTCLAYLVVIPSKLRRPLLRRLIQFVSFAKSFDGLESVFLTLLTDAEQAGDAALMNAALGAWAMYGPPKEPGGGLACSFLLDPRTHFVTAVEQSALEHLGDGGTSMSTSSGGSGVAVQMMAIANESAGANGGAEPSAGSSGTDGGTQPSAGSLLVQGVTEGVIGRACAFAGGYWGLVFGPAEGSQFTNSCNQGGTVIAGQVSGSGPITVGTLSDFFSTDGRTTIYSITNADGSTTLGSTTSTNNSDGSQTTVLNGVTKYPDGSVASTTNGSGTTVSNPDGSTTTTSSTTTNNVDGSVAQVSTTTTSLASGASTTTTTTTVTDTNGNSSTTSTTTTTTVNSDGSTSTTTTQTDNNDNTTTSTSNNDDPTTTQ